MGQVYRATDTNLKRQVAIKVLPAALADDADRLARFQREAEVLAALNHPHIAQIYGLEKSVDGTALVMELVEGDDLSRRIARGAIPLDEALPIARQIAEALEAAHEPGIIHRDLTLQPGIGGSIHLPHSAFADLGSDLVDAKARACREGQGWGL